MKSIKLSTFQVGTKRKAGEGLRICTARRPPRGVPRGRIRVEGNFDAWLPLLAPSLSLLARTLRDRLGEPAIRRRFFAAYEREMTQTEARHTIAFLARLAQTTPISIGCFCEDEACCHRSRLRLLIEHAASQDAL